ncbi:MAG: hypothetical protein GEU79_06510 [Acidimicrobiia bacterium]|nr:hypothetical protein [Acidimicrobiia bacterium]
MRATFALGVSMILMVVACTDEPGDTADSVDPEGVVTTAIDLMSQERYNDIAGLTDTSQAELLLLLEGMPPDDILSTMEEESTVVAANFWEGFGESSAGGLQADASVSAQSEVEIGSERGFVVTVTLPDGRQKRWVVRDSPDGPVIDLFASFASGFAGSLIGPVDRLLTEQTEDGRRLLGLLVSQLDSLGVASDDPNITTTESQEIITLIERISRAQG